MLHTQDYAEYLLLRKEIHALQQELAVAQLYNNTPFLREVQGALKFVELRGNSRLQKRLCEWN